ncbi:hypothetical protein BH09PSE5_BH09PSE5_01070 [soil metagenome]
MYLTSHYDPVLVGASLLIATLSAYLMLDLAKRVRPDARGLALGLWVGGAVAMGTGIWSMHFVGMLAYSLPIELGYNRLPTLFSWLAGVSASAVALWVASLGTLTAARLACGSLAMGLGICLMHYVGMSALEVAPGIAWNYWTVALSAVIAVAASASALTIFFWLRRFDRHASASGFQLGASVVMGIAVAGMHYTGMGAANFIEGTVCLSADALNGSTLGAMVILTSLTLLVLTLVTSAFEARLHGHTVQLARSLKRTNRELSQRAQLLAQAEELAHIGSRETNLVTRETTLSHGMFRLFGEAPIEGPIPADWLTLRIPIDERQLVDAAHDSLAANQTFEIHHRIVHANAGLRDVLHRGRIECDATGTPARLHETLQDVTSQRQAEQALHDLAHIDLPTGLPNRTALLDFLHEPVVRATRDGHAIALLVVRVDQFRLANEILGHAAGDHLLQALARRVADALPAAGIVAHLGAGEFALLLADSDSEDVVEVAGELAARALLDAISAPFDIGGVEVSAKCAVGIALCPDDAQSAGGLLDHARSATLLAREPGTDGFHFYTAEASTRATTRLALGAALRRAIARDELYLCYQPQVELATGKIVGVEALARWKNAERGEISPVEFIPLAEQLGLIVPIGEWILRKACTDCARWERLGLAFVRVGVNLSMQQLLLPDIAQSIQGILVETGLDPHRLGVEITESMLLDKVDHVAETLLQLQSLGIEISLDDFGTGYSNLSYLSKLPIDVLKIDRSFVCDATAPTQDVTLMRTLIRMAHGLGMQVIAEGVENEAQLALLVASKCDQIQGYYFSRPLKEDALVAMLQQDKQLPDHLRSRRSHARTLLLVDDDPYVTFSLQRLLKDDGYHIIVARDGAQGLQRLAEHDVDVLISDQRMPGMSGADFLHRARELFPETVRMSLSGYSDLQAITDAINDGSVYKFIMKPWDDERLRRHVADAFRHKEIVDENHALGQALRSARDDFAQVSEQLAIRSAVAPPEELPVARASALAIA